MLGVSNAVLLFALGLGFFVCYFAKKADDELKALGRVVGLIIMGLATLFIFLNFIMDPPSDYSAKRPVSCVMHKGMMR